MENSMIKFVRRVFETNPDCTTLTKGDLRAQYVKENELPELDKTERKLFSTVVNNVLVEFADHLGIKDNDDVEVKSNNVSHVETEANGKIESLVETSQVAAASSPSSSDVLVDCDNATNGSNSDAEDIASDTSGVYKFPSSPNTEACVSVETDSPIGKKKCNSAKKPIVWDDDDIDSSDSEALVIIETEDQEQQAGDNKPVTNDMSDEEENKPNASDAVSKRKLTPEKIENSKRRKVSSEKKNEADSSSDGENANEPMLLKSKNQSEPEDAESLNSTLSDDGEMIETAGKNHLKCKVESPVKKLSESKTSIASSSSEDENLASLRLREQQKSKESDPDSEKDSDDDDDDDDSGECVNKPRKSKLSASALEKGEENSSSDEISLSSSDEVDESKKTQKSKSNKRKESSRRNKKESTNSASNAKIDRLKKYLRAAGLHIQSYNKLWETCRSAKAKAEKLLEVLEKEGLKGRPTLEKCKKLKRKIERKKEIESLDVSNIIETERGRPRRNACSFYRQKNELKTPEIENHFTSLKDIVDSDDGDQPVRKFSRLKGAIDSEGSD